MDFCMIMHGSNKLCWIFIFLEEKEIFATASTFVFFLLMQDAFLFFKKEKVKYVFKKKWNTSVIALKEKYDFFKFNVRGSLWVGDLWG